MNSPQASEHFPNSFYRVSVKGLCVRDGKLLMSLDATCFRDGEQKSLWELPGGGMDFGETLQQALTREVKEEMGLEVVSIAEKPTYLWTYKKAGRNPHGVEMWWWILFIAFRFDVKDLNITASEECEEIRFFSKEELQHADVNDQMKQLRSLFNPGDFV